MHKFELYTPIKAHIAVFWIIISCSSHHSSDRYTASVFRFVVNIYILVFES